MGARPEDYAISAPYKSYIHVDDFDGPKELADFLHKLDLDDQKIDYEKILSLGAQVKGCFFLRRCPLEPTVMYLRKPTRGMCHKPHYH